MADTDVYRAKIKELEGHRRANLRQAKRAKTRRRKALRQRRWKDARSALHTYRKNREEAQKNLRDIRALRKARHKHNILVRLARSRRRVLGHSGFVWFDGHQVCSWIAEDLKRARSSGIWGGVVISGYRTPAYSESLCYAMCNRPACPGKCAGRNTNHARGPAYPDGAVDVTDSYGLMNAERRLGLRLKHTLPYDLPHHSHTGQ